MSRRLIILCTSARPDPYFNVISYASLNLDLRDFVLVVVGDEIQPDLTNRAATIADDLSRFVDHLAAGKYWSKEPATGADYFEDLKDPEGFTAAIEGMQWGSLQIARRGLPESQLHEVLKEASVNSVFDVTSCKNSVVAGVAAWLTSRGGSSIYSFELRKPPSYGQDDLLPAMEVGQYIYRDLSTSQLLDDAVKSVNKLTLNRKTFAVVSLLVAIVVGLASLTFSQTVALSAVTALASFASIISLLTYFLRD